MSDLHANGPALILIAHGSRREAANHAHLQLCAEVSARLGREVAPAFLELASPTIPEAIDDAVHHARAGHIVLVPYFLHPGNHTLRDIPAIIAEARTRHPAVVIDQRGHVGSSDGMVGLIADHFAVT